MYAHLHLVQVFTGAYFTLQDMASFFGLVIWEQCNRWYWILLSSSTSTRLQQHLAANSPPSSCWDGRLPARHVSHMSISFNLDNTPLLTTGSCSRFRFSIFLPSNTILSTMGSLIQVRLVTTCWTPYIEMCKLEMCDTTHWSTQSEHGGSEVLNFADKLTWSLVIWDRQWRSELSLVALELQLTLDARSNVVEVLSNQCRWLRNSISND